MNKQIFKGFKQVTAAQFNAAKEANELVGYLWLVRTEVANEGTNNVDDDEYDLYFGSKQYGHYRAGELDALRDAILKLNGDVEDILATLQALTTLAEKNKTDIATNAAGIAANAAEIADLKDKVDLLPTFDVKVVTELPSDEEAKEKVLYLKKDSEDEGNLYTEYIYVEGKWENLGQQKVDLKDYYTKSEIDTALAGKIDAVKVNGIDATVTEGVAEVTVNATDVKLGAAITADGQEVYTSDKKLSEVLQGIQDSISVAVSGGLTGIVSGNGIEVSEVAGNKQTVSVKVSAADGNLLLMNEDGGLYAAMYYEGDDIE
jgi:hypothetical protein